METGRPAAEQCEGCTFSTTHINELSYLHSRDVSYATFCQGPYEESSRYRDFMGWTIPWYSVPQDAVDRLVANRHFGILVTYLRDDNKVYETYWTTGRGNELMARIRRRQARRRTQASHRCGQTSGLLLAVIGCWSRPAPSCT